LPNPTRLVGRIFIHLLIAAKRGCRKYHDVTN
jgi:hypothetical protein